LFLRGLGPRDGDKGQHEKLAPKLANLGELKLDA